MVKVLILLSTYNGEKYLKEQLDSLFSQSYKNFEIIIRDDGSIDKTLDILRNYNIKLLSGENIGVKKSFEILLKYAYENCNEKYIMFCDQDDVWNDDKVEKTLKKMYDLENLYGNNIPLLVHTDLEVVDEKLQTLSSSMWKSEYIDPRVNVLNRLLLQNTITGCTMMINRTLAQKSLPISDKAVMHDWWIGLVATTFGQIGFINEATIKYRQHAQNSIGAKGYNLNYIKKNMYKEKNIINKYVIQAKAFLESYFDLLTDKQKNILNNFVKLKDFSFFKKRFLLFKYKFFKQGLLRNIGLFIKI